MPDATTRPTPRSSLPRIRAAPAALVVDVLREAFALAIGSRCVGCGAPAPSLCSGCRPALRGDPRRQTVAGGTGADAASPAPLVVVSALDYTGAVKRALPAFKDSGVLALGGPLGAALRGAILDAAAAAAGGGGIEIAPIPSSPGSRRSRGFSPVAVLVHRAGFVASPVLRTVASPSDQVGLSAGDRWRNRTGVLAARHDLVGRRFLIVDDLVTTGATLVDAAAALRRAGAEVVGAATVAATPRRIPPAVAGPPR